MEFVCRCKCSKKFSEKEKKIIFERFNDLATHTEQTLFLQSCVRPSPIARRRKRIVNGGKERVTTFKYCFEVERRGQQDQIQVCKKAFLLLLGLKASRLREKVQIDRSTPHDGRGTHQNRPNRISIELLDKARNFIANLPARDSHYSRKIGKEKKYLDSCMTIKGLHKEFILKNPDCNSVIKYDRFADIFNTEFNVSFGYPRSDICDTCEKLHATMELAKREGKDKKDIKVIDDQIKLLQMRADSFYKKRIEMVTSITIRRKRRLVSIIKKTCHYR